MGDNGLLDFEKLVGIIAKIHKEMAIKTSKAINIGLTLRNWFIGYYIHEYEMQGSDRAIYGDKMLTKLSIELEKNGLKRVEERELRRFRRFYIIYPQIREAVTPEFRKRLLSPSSGQMKREVMTPEFRTKGETLLENLSFTHLDELLKLDDPLKRCFYEMECIRGNWSVRELKRQISSLYYERSGLSKNKKKLAELASCGVEKNSPELTVRDPYIFEFLGLKSQEVMGESALEDKLLDRLQEFLLELGHGFCFEARQKRILIGDEYFFVDLVFYHRLLKCHVLVELKVDSFKHEHLGQLNTYLSWYEENEMTEGDNPPVGLLLCTQKNHALVRYALAGMSNQLFVSRYQLELPRKEQIEQLIQEQMEELGYGE